MRQQQQQGQQQEGEEEEEEKKLRRSRRRKTEEKTEEKTDYRLRCKVVNFRFAPRKIWIPNGLSLKDLSSKDASPNVLSPKFWLLEESSPKRFWPLFDQKGHFSLPRKYKEPIHKRQHERESVLHELNHNLQKKLAVGRDANTDMWENVGKISCCLLNFFWHITQNQKCAWNTWARKIWW